jgi:hypothetical protein
MSNRGRYYSSSRTPNDYSDAYLDKAATVHRPRLPKRSVSALLRCLGSDYLEKKLSGQLTIRHRRRVGIHLHH